MDEITGNRGVIFATGTPVSNSMTELYTCLLYTSRQTLKEEYAAFWTAYQQDRDLLRFRYHRPREIWENLKDLDLPRRTFSSELSQVPTCLLYTSLRPDELVTEIFKKE